MTRGYTLIEVDFGQASAWDLDLITKCLEVIRKAFPQIVPEGAAAIEYDLLAVTSPHNGTAPGPHYPAIGMHCPTKEAEESVAALGFFAFYDRADKWVLEVGLDNLKARALSVQNIDWGKLQRVGSYPQR